MSQLSHFLQAGVHVHPFSDRSGTVLFNEKTTQMLQCFYPGQAESSPVRLFSTNSVVSR